MGLFSFQGRAGRMQFWLTTLALTVISGVIEFMSKSVGALLLVLLVPLLWAGIAVAVKRWHDRDKSGWWWFINFIPIIGGIWALVENGFLKGSEGKNRFGADPVT